MSSPSAVPPIETQSSLSEPERLINTFVAPSKTFNDIRRNASWWVPWLIMSVFGILFTYAVTSKIGWEQVMHNETAKNPAAMERLDKMPPEQKAQALRMQANIGKYMGYSSPIFALLALIIIATVLMATFNFGLGADVKFGTALATTAYAWLPSIVSSLLAIVSMFAGADPEGFNIRNPVATNLGAFLSPTGNRFLYALASAVDIIAIWIVILLGIGFACNTKVKRGTAIGVVAAWYVAVKLAGAAFAAMF
jgi:hypothetical protein